MYTWVYYTNTLQRCTVCIASHATSLFFARWVGQLKNDRTLKVHKAIQNDAVKTVAAEKCVRKAATATAAAQKMVTNQIEFSCKSHKVSVRVV